MRNGSLFQSLLLIALTAADSIANAKPVTIPIAKVGGGELSSVLPSENVLLYLLLINVGYIAWGLIKDVIGHYRKKTDNTAERLDQLFQVVQEIRSEVHHMKERSKNIPDEDRVELMVMKALRSHGK